MYRTPFAEGTTSKAIFPVRSAFAPAESVNDSATSVESRPSAEMTATLAGFSITPMCGLSGPRCRNASPSPAAINTGKTNVQKTASGSRMNPLNRHSVIWYNG